MKIIIHHQIDLIDLPESLARKIRDTFTLENPKWLDNEKMGRWNGGTKRRLYFYESHNGALTVPRGALGLVLFFCKEMGIRFELEDHRRSLPEENFTFNGTLKGYQERAVKDILGRDFGVLQAPTGSGKTVMTLAVR